MKFLHLDDEVISRLSVRRVLSDADFLLGHELDSVGNISTFLELMKKGQYECVLIDLNLGPQQTENGIQVMERARAISPTTPAIILSNTDDSHLMTLAIQNGAADFISKSKDLDLLPKAVFRASCQKDPRNLSACSTWSQQLQARVDATGETLQQLILKLDRALKRGVSPLLVRGESGTGKEVVADTLEKMVDEQGPFLRVNCASFRGETLESELFGHKKGAFTGADRDKKGLFECADRGWLFLDEIAQLNPACQASLLRTLENGEIRPLGSTTTSKVHVRIIAATNEDLEELATQGHFRRDLLERLRSYEFWLPPWRERSLQEKDQILEFLLRRLNQSFPDEQKFRLDHATRKVLLHAPFRQSNMRELWKVLQSASVEAEDNTITLAALPHHFLQEFQDGEISLMADEELAVETASSVPAHSSVTPATQFSESLDVSKGYPALEKMFFLQVLIAWSNKSPERLKSVRMLSQALGLGRHTVTKKIRELHESGELPKFLRHLV